MRTRFSLAVLCGLVATLASGVPARAQDSVNVGPVGVVPPGIARPQLVTSQQAPPSSTDLAIRAVGGMGMYVWRWERTGTVDDVVARAKASGIGHLVVRASSQPDGFYLAPILGDLLPKAHAAGIKVVAYDPPRLEDVEADVTRAHQLITFRAQGQGIDAFAADIEPRWDVLTPERAAAYGARLRQVAGPGFPLIGIVYPPNQVARFPFAAVAKDFDVLSPMSYWRAKTVDSGAYIRASVEQLRAFGKPVSVIGQAFAYGGGVWPDRAGHPSPAELDLSIRAARETGAIGMSFWVWEHSEPWVFDTIRASGWAAPAGDGAGLRPPAPYPMPPPGQPAGATVAPPPATIVANPVVRSATIVAAPSPFVPAKTASRPLLLLVCLGLAVALTSRVPSILGRGTLERCAAVVRHPLRVRPLAAGVTSCVLAAAERGAAPIVRAWVSKPGHTKPPPRHAASRPGARKREEKRAPRPRAIR